MSRSYNSSCFSLQLFLILDGVTFHLLFLSIEEHLLNDSIDDDHNGWGDQHYGPDYEDLLDWDGLEAHEAEVFCEETKRNEEKNVDYDDDCYWLVSPDW